MERRDRNGKIGKEENICPFALNSEKRETTVVSPFESNQCLRIRHVSHVGSNPKLIELRIYSVKVADTVKLQQSYRLVLPFFLHRRGG